MNTTAFSIEDDKPSPFLMGRVGVCGDADALGEEPPSFWTAYPAAGDELPSTSLRGTMGHVSRVSSSSVSFKQDDPSMMQHPYSPEGATSLRGHRRASYAMSESSDDVDNRDSIYHTQENLGFHFDIWSVCSSEGGVFDCDGDMGIMLPPGGFVNFSAVAVPATYAASTSSLSRVFGAEDNEQRRESMHNGNSATNQGEDYSELDSITSASIERSFADSEQSDLEGFVVEVVDDDLISVITCEL